jgi:hypothetical protein
MIYKACIVSLKSGIHALESIERKKVKVLVELALLESLLTDLIVDHFTNILDDKISWFQILIHSKTPTLFICLKRQSQEIDFNIHNNNKKKSERFFLIPQKVQPWHTVSSGIFDLYRIFHKDIDRAYIHKMSFCRFRKIRYLPLEEGKKKGWKISHHLFTQFEPHPGTP